MVGGRRVSVGCAVGFRPAFAFCISFNMATLSAALALHRLSASQHYEAISPRKGKTRTPHD